MGITYAETIELLCPGGYPGGGYPGYGGAGFPGFGGRLKYDRGFIGYRT